MKYRIKLDSGTTELVFRPALTASDALFWAERVGELKEKPDTVSIIRDEVISNE